MKATLIFAITLALIGSSLAEKVVSCYYGSWANYRQGNGACKVEHLNPFMCTHLIYGFVGLNDDDGSIRIMDPWLELPDDWGKDNFGQFNKLKQVNTKLKTIIAIGGWNEGSARYSKVASDPVLRGNFVRNAAEFTVKYGFDGFDLDWEYPGQRDTVNDAEDIHNHALLIQEMRDEFDKHGLLLTAAVAAVRKSAELSYDFETLGRVIDLLHVMVYDMWGAWETTTGHNAALHKYQPQVPDPDSFDVETAINFWLSTGVPREKIIMGMPLYGRSFSLASAGSNGVGAAVTGAGIAGQYSGERGMLGLNEFCERRQSESWTEVWDSVGEVPYAYKDTDWVTFDNFESLTKKTQLAMAKDLGGVFVWSIETDDFMGICNPQKFPYLRTINSVIGRVIDETTTSTTEDPNSSSTSSSTSTTEGGGTDPTGICTKPGYVRDPKNCAVFYNCVASPDGGYISYRYECAPGLAYDDIRNVCDYADQVQC